MLDHEMIHALNGSLIEATCLLSMNSLNQKLDSFLFIYYFRLGAFRMSQDSAIERSSDEEMIGQRSINIHYFIIIMLLISTRLVF